jgi:hypothetical protein
MVFIVKSILRFKIVDFEEYLFKDTTHPQNSTVRLTYISRL